MKTTPCVGSGVARHRTARRTTTAEPQPTTTSINRGDQNTSIDARATGLRQPANAQPSSTNQIPEPAAPRTPFTDNPARTGASASRPAYKPTMSDQDRAAFAANSDVYLEVPDLHVDQILLDVDNVNVHLALDARVANLVSLKAGADVGIGRVKLEIRGVQAEAYLVVRLDNVAKILDRTLTTIDKNPQILEKLLSTVNNTVGTVGNVANTALQPGGVVSQTVGTVGQTLNNVTAPGGVLTQTVNTLGQTVQRTLDTTGNIVKRTLDTAGGVLNQRTIARLLDLPVISQTTNTAGQAVKRVRDSPAASSNTRSTPRARSSTHASSARARAPRRASEGDRKP